MHLCSALTWQLEAPRVQGENGGFFSSEIYLKARLLMGGRKRILRLEFLLHCTYLGHFLGEGGSSFYLRCIFLGNYT